MKDETSVLAYSIADSSPLYPGMPNKLHASSTPSHLAPSSWISVWQAGSLLFLPKHTDFLCRLLESSPRPLTAPLFSLIWHWEVLTTIWPIHRDTIQSGKKKTLLGFMPGVTGSQTMSAWRYFLRFPNHGRERIASNSIYFTFSKNQEQSLLPRIKCFSFFIYTKLWTKSWSPESYNSRKTTNHSLPEVRDGTGQSKIVSQLILELSETRYPTQN